MGNSSSSPIAPATQPRTVKSRSSALANPLERSHAMQLALDKEFFKTDIRVTVGRTTLTATSGKIDPDNGSAFDLGPGTIKFLTMSAQHHFSFGTLQGVFSKADARLATFNGIPGVPAHCESD